MNPVPQVRGTVLRGILRDVKETVAGGVSAFMGYIPTVDRDRYFHKSIIHTQWYPYEALVILLETYHRHVARYDDREIVKLGIRSAERDLTTLLKAYALLTDPWTVGERARLIWPQKYSVGEMTLSRKWENGFELELRGFSNIHRLNCLLITGYIEGFGKHWRRTFRTTHTRCVRQGHGVCSFSSVW